MESGPQLTHVLLLANADHHAETGPALWAMIDDVRRYFGVTRGSASHARVCVTVGEPPELVAAVAPEEHLVLDDHTMEELIESAAGRFNSTLAPEAVVGGVRKLLEQRGVQVGGLVVVTDQELEPPNGWRYLLWRQEGDSGVQSIAALDPEYWGVPATSSWPSIVQRARPACMCLTGSLAGLERCSNPRCFMFEAIDSLLRLDHMTEMGPEHPGFVPHAAAVEHVEAT